MKSKEADETESLLEKGKAWCLDSWQGTQSICSYLTGPKQPLEIKDPNLEPKGWPKRACKMLDVTATATVTALKGIWRDLSLNSRPTLCSVPRILPVYESCTKQPRLKKCTSTPSSHNWPTDKRFNETLRTWKTSVFNAQTCRN